MREKQASQKHQAAAAVALAALLCLLSSCAGTNSDTKGDSPEATISDAALLEDGEKGATEVKDSEVFSDLTDVAEAPAEMTVSSEGSTAEVAGTTKDAEGDSYYDAVGGERLGRVAYTLYGSKSFVKNLLSKNPDLKGVKTLAAEQKVYFDINTIRPQPTYLTKGLLKRYSSQLAERLNAWRAEKGAAKSTVTVAPGETLQSISRRLYGSSRYWPELFLLNIDKIQDYDRIETGLTLAAYEHGGSAPGVAEKTAEAPAVPLVSPAGGALLAPPAAEPTRPSAPPAPVVATPAPVDTQAAAPAPALDPIPETPAPAPQAANAPERKEVKPVSDEAKVESGASSNLRRGLYLTLVLLLAGIAFYLTRPKRKPKFDMLDMTAADTAERPKLNPVPEGTQHNIG